LIKLSKEIVIVREAEVDQVMKNIKRNINNSQEIAKKSKEDRIAMTDVIKKNKEIEIDQEKKRKSKKCIASQNQVQ
jgi:hypothetical protein